MTSASARLDARSSTPLFQTQPSGWPLRTRMKIGFGSAVGVVLFAISAGFALLYNRIFLRDA